MYIIRHKTKRDGSGMMTTNDIDEVKKKVKSLFKQKLEATVFEDDAVIGRVWKDDSQRIGWNYYLHDTYSTYSTL